MGVELLAPAGTSEHVAAAVHAGADAVYLGFGRFNARRNARNFTFEELKNAVSFCHVRGVRVHAAFNTLCKEDELSALEEDLRLLALAGVDALIVQDLGTARLVRACTPEIPLHASTQMAVHNRSGVRMLEEMGFSRVIPARELTLSEIRDLCASTSMEVEVFVHGALCMCVSGECYLSSVLGQRSGNRGLCAQPCRLDFRINGRDHALSLKDMCHIPHVEELREAGVASLKIEGRMKRPEYVFASVSACRAALEGKTPDLDTLRAVFSRSGFTDGYLTGKRDLSMFGFRQKEDVTAAAPVLKPLAAQMEKETMRVGITMRAKIDRTASELTVGDGKNTVTVTGETPEEARTHALTETDALRQLVKTGGTPYFVEKAEADIGENVSFAPGALNELRRRALALLTDERARIRPHAFTPLAFAPETRPHAGCALWVRVPKLSMLSLCRDDVTVVLPPEEITRETCARFAHAVAEVPALVFPKDEERVKNQLIAAREAGAKSAYCENIGAVTLAKQAGLTPVAGCGMNLLNSLALAQAKDMGVKSAVVSFEIGANELRSLRTDLKLGVLVYGRLPLMRFRACPAQRENGCGACIGENVLTDRMGVRFPLLCSGKRYTTLLNSVPLYVSDKKMPETDFRLLSFTLETPEEVRDRVRDVRDGALPAFERTNGLYFKNLR